MLNELKQKLAEEEKLTKKDDIELLSVVASEKEKTTNFQRYSSGIDFIDDVAKLRESDKGGVAGGDIVIVAAPTGNGKTLFAATLSFGLLKNEGIPSLWFTYEVSTYSLWQIFKEMGAHESDFLCVPFEHITGKLEWVHAKIKEAKEKFMVKAVVIDHLGFLSPFQKFNQNMSQNYSSYLTQVVRELKTIAVEENIIIILPVHMVKSATEELTLRDIGHSGGIAQESDFVFLLAREENPKTKLGITMEDYYSQYTKVIMAKNRIGGKTPSFWMTKKDGKLEVTIYEQKNEDYI